MTGAELAIFIETVRGLLDDGDLLGLGVLVLRARGLTVPD